YHRPTRTLLGADIVLCAGAKDHWTWRYAARITGCYERLRVPPDVRKKIADKTAAAHSIHAMLERPAQRLIVGHADVIEEDCRERLAQAWRLEGVEAYASGALPAALDAGKGRKPSRPSWSRTTWSC